MDELEIKSLWQNYDRNLKKSLALNYKNLEEIQKLKAKSALRPIWGIKIFSVIAGIAWILCACFIVYHLLAWSNLFFVISACIHIFLSSLAIIVYINHLVLINQIDNSESVMEAMEKLAAIQSSTFQITRLLMLQLPIFTIFYINENMWRNGSMGLWIFQITLTTLSIIGSIWLFRNINPKNMHKKWFRFLFSGPEWTPVIKAMQLLKEIEAYKQE